MLGLIETLVVKYLFVIMEILNWDLEVKLIISASLKISDMNFILKFMTV